MGNIIYTGVFFELSSIEQEELLKLRGWDCPAHWCDIFLHHVTLEFRPDADGDHLRKVLEHEGKPVDVKIVGATPFHDLTYGFRNPVAAFEVALDPTLQALGIECANRTPHLTVATNGCAPFLANKADYEPFDGPTLTGRLGVFREGSEVSLKKVPLVLKHKETICALYADKENTLDELADLYDVSRGTITKIIRDNGGTIRNRGTGIRIWCEAERERLNNMYTNGMTISEIGRRENTLFHTMRKRLIKYGIKK